ncbi:hypothetical protein [Bacillus atrophaeus]|uniref:hypothetical protein n=1 Tax=Bacillus atrophaeus TaxID=1452 RepID=UPI00399CF280
MKMLDEIGFTEEQYHELSQTMTDEAIARNELYCAPATLYVWKRRNGVQRKLPYHPFTLDEWLEKREAKWTHQQIADHYNFPNFQVYLHYKRKIGVPTRPKRKERVKNES